MRSIFLIVLLALFAHGKELGANHMDDTDDSVDQLVDKLVDRLLANNFHLAPKALPLQRVPLGWPSYVSKPLHAFAKPVQPVHLRAEPSFASRLPPHFLLGGQLRPLPNVIVRAEGSEELMQKTMPELRDMLGQLGSSFKSRKKQELVDEVMKLRAGGAPSPPPVYTDSSDGEYARAPVAAPSPAAAVKPATKAPAGAVAPAKVMNIKEMGTNPFLQDRKPKPKMVVPPQIGGADISSINIPVPTPAQNRGDPEPEVCPGYKEPCRFGADIYTTSYVVCAKLLDDKTDKTSHHKWTLDENEKDFWDITNQAWMWDDKMVRNGGDSWCINLWAFSQLIQKVGCENAQLNCAATDVSWVHNEHGWGKYDFGSVPFLGLRKSDLPPAKECIKQLCNPPNSGDPGPKPGVPVPK